MKVLTLKDLKDTMLYLGFLALVMVAHTIVDMLKYSKF